MFDLSKTAHQGEFFLKLYAPDENGVGGNITTSQESVAQISPRFARSSHLAVHYELLVHY